MRISADPKSPDYIPESITAKVMFDGEELFGCVTADDESGECIVHATGDDGKIIVADGEIVVKTIHGKVEIILAN